MRLTIERTENREQKYWFMRKILLNDSFWDLYISNWFESATGRSNLEEQRETYLVCTDERQRFESSSGTLEELRVEFDPVQSECVKESR